MPSLFEAPAESDDFRTVFSPCRTYRYVLVRCWAESLPRIVFIGLNPSTADEHVDDNTIRRLKSFAKQWGFGSMVMLNLFAYRATNPKILTKLPDAAGCPENDRWIELNVNRVKTVVVAWGADKAGGRREKPVLSL